MIATRLYYLYSYLPTWQNFGDAAAGATPSGSCVYGTILDEECRPNSRRLGGCVDPCWALHIPPCIAIKPFHHLLVPSNTKFHTNQVSSIYSRATWFTYIRLLTERCIKIKAFYNWLWSDNSLHPQRILAVGSNPASNCKSCRLSFQSFRSWVEMQRFLDIFFGVHS